MMLVVQDSSWEVILGTDLLTKCEGFLNLKENIFAVRNSVWKLESHNEKDIPSSKITIDVIQMEANDMSP